MTGGSKYICNNIYIWSKDAVNRRNRIEGTYPY